MGRIYGRTWITSFGDRDDGTWLAALQRLTPEQVGQGLDACIRGGSEWPPNLPQFLRLCIAGSDAAVKDMSDPELIRECRGLGIETAGRSRKSLEASLEYTLLEASVGTSRKFIQ